MSFPFGLGAPGEAIHSIADGHPSMCLVAIIETTPGQEISLAGFRAVADASAGPPKRVRTVLLEKMIKGGSWGFAIAFSPFSRAVVYHRTQSRRNGRRAPATEPRQSAVLVARNFFTDRCPFPRANVCLNADGLVVLEPLQYLE